MKIDLPKIYLGRQKAAYHVARLAKKLKIAVPSPTKFKEDILLKNPQKTFRVNFSEEVEHTRLHGKANMLQAWYDAEDRYLQPALSFGFFGDGPDGISLTMTSRIGSHETKITSGVIEAPEVALADDICFYRKATCESFNNRDTIGFARSFRAYLYSSVAMVDCFLFRYAFFIREKIGDATKYDNTALLDSRANIEKRLEAWVITFAAHHMEKFKSWPERSKFIELKNKRNAFIHPYEPSVPYSPKDVVKYLNYAREGIGGLLAKLRKSSNESSRIGFITQLSNVPLATLKNK